MGFWSGFRKPEPVISPEISELTKKLDHLCTIFSAENGAYEEKKEIGALKGQVEELEIRFENLKKQCLRYLQSGSTRLKKAQEIEAGFEDDPDEVPAAPLPPEIAQPQEEEVDDFTWAAEQIRKTGNTPI